jgi:hypothetical protein
MVRSLDSRRFLFASRMEPPPQPGIERPEGDSPRSSTSAVGDDGSPAVPPEFSGVTTTAEAQGWAGLGHETDVFSRGLSTTYRSPSSPRHR